MDEAKASDRWAIYWAPARASRLWALGTGWLGADPESGRLLTPSLPPDWHWALAEPRRYGFHMTLKAPFRLAQGTTPAGLAAALASFAAARRPVPLPPLVLADLDGFVALIPATPAAELDELAADVVTAFDRFRAPLDNQERARRRPEELDPIARELLDRWGYPHVLRRFRPHLTLTARLTPAQRLAIDRWVTLFRLELADERQSVTELALFHEPAPGRPFRLAARFPMAGRGLPAGSDRA
jgi:putative phosphonate metabolism protein